MPAPDPDDSTDSTNTDTNTETDTGESFGDIFERFCRKEQRFIDHLEADTGGTVVRTDWNRDYITVKLKFDRGDDDE